MEPVTDAVDDERRAQILAMMQDYGLDELEAALAVAIERGESHGDVESLPPMSDQTLPAALETEARPVDPDEARQASRPSCSRPDFLPTSSSARRSMTQGLKSMPHAALGKKRLQARRWRSPGFKQQAPFPGPL